MSGSRSLGQIDPSFVALRPPPRIAGDGRAALALVNDGPSDGALGLGALTRSCDALGVALRPSPHADALDRRTMARAQALGLLDGPDALVRYRAGRFTTLTATAYPNASVAVLQVANDWHYWLWSFDDRTDVRGRDLADDLARHERVVAVLLDLLAGRDLPATPDAEDPSVIFLSMILADLRSVAPAGCVGRFRGAVRDYLVRGSLPGAHNWAVAHTPDPDTILAQRIHEGAYDTIVSFIELAAGCEAVDAVVTSADARRAALLSNMIVVVSNDIFSYEKEVMHNGSPNNLLHAVLTHERRDLRSGYHRLVAMVEAWTAELLDLAARTDGDLRRYIRANYTWLAASYRWHLLSGRYASPTSPFAELRRDSSDASRDEHRPDVEEQGEAEAEVEVEVEAEIEPSPAFAPDRAPYSCMHALPAAILV